MRDTATWLLWRTGGAALARKVLASGGRFSVLFHGVADRRYDEVPAAAQPDTTVDELRFILDWLHARDFALLTLDAFLHTDEPGVLLTFDDGFANNFSRALPVLETYEAPAVYFITTQHIVEPRNWLPATRQMARRGWGDEAAVPEDVAHELYDGMTVEQLAACAANPLITIGGHTSSHPFLSQLEPGAVREELTASKQFLEEVTGREVDSFAYPTGDYSRAVAEAVRDCGYRSAFALDPLPVGMPAYEIPRVGLYYADRPYLSVKLSGLHRRPLKGPLVTERV